MISGNLVPLSNELKTTGWVTGVYTCFKERKTRFFEAKVYSEGSQYGINGGKVSKLAVGKEAIRNRNANYDEQLDYAYDRGLSINNLPEHVLLGIVSELEKL